jgi:hypothetical protein
MIIYMLLILIHRLYLVYFVFESVVYLGNISIGTIDILTYCIVFVLEFF